MKIERLKDLADAYGADLRRWPVADGRAAGALKGSDPAGVERALFEARQTDLALNASRTAVVSAALRDRVIASAAAAGLTPTRAKWIMGRLAWMSGAGWAAAACAGVVAGMTLTTHITTDQQIDAVLYQATLDGVDDTEVLG